MSRTAEFEAGHRLNRTVDAPSLAGPSFDYVGKHIDTDGSARSAHIGIDPQDAYDERRWSRYD